jgi:hypothetical protein
VCWPGRWVSRRLDVGVESSGRASGSMVRVVRKSALGDEIDEISYWSGVAVEERIAAVEVLRRRMYGGDDGA